MIKTPFDNAKYLKAQEKAIRERMAKFKGKLYLEIGGKLYQDFHASRTLPGYDPDTKMKLLKKLKSDSEIIFCISAKQLLSGKQRGDWGLSYDLSTFVSLENLKDFGFLARSVIINRYQGEKEADILKKKLERKGYRVYIRYEISGYPENRNTILSQEGYGKDEYIFSKKPLIIVWGAGPGSGKFSTCLGQVFLDQKKGLDSGYAKFETFPIWNLALDHPVNLAYEASTADLGDVNLVDPYHMAVYKKTAINYNRDMEAFPILLSLVKQFIKKKNYITKYRSPTDMGINMMKVGIDNENEIIKAAKREILFYLFRYRQEYLKGLVDKDTIERMDRLIKTAKISLKDYYLIKTARKTKAEAEKDKRKGENGNYSGAALEIKNGRIVTGKNSALLHAEAACFLNTIKTIAKIPDKIDLIPKHVIKNLGYIKLKVLKEQFGSLNLGEVLVSLAIIQSTNPMVKKVLKTLPELKDCYLHTTSLPLPEDEAIFRKLRIWVTSD